MILLPFSHPPISILVFPPSVPPPSGPATILCLMSSPPTWVLQVGGVCREFFSILLSREANP